MLAYAAQSQAISLVQPSVIHRADLVKLTRFFLKRRADRWEPSAFETRA